MANVAVDVEAKKATERLVIGVQCSEQFIAVCEEQAFRFLSSGRVRFEIWSKLSCGLFQVFINKTCLALRLSF